jgi:hypothetical protein
MQPAALSVEPLVIFGALIFLVGVLPVAMWVTAKAPTKLRVPFIGIGLIALVYTTFNLGRMTGLSMAWYHWKREYKEPLWELQTKMDDYLKAADTNSLVNVAQRFTNENIQRYGLEKLFEQGKFRAFVEALPTKQEQK